jgi:hypothetical protein
MKKEDNLIRSDQDPESVNLEEDDSSSGFEPDTVENLPQLHVPDLPEDATSIPPEALANLPVLTETAAPQDSESIEQVVSDTQDDVPQAESWSEVCQMRISNLAGEIQSLHERLDRIEKRTKV